MTEKHTIYLDTELFETISQIYKVKNFSSISELINKAVEEWLARETGQAASGYISKELVTLIENTILLSERRINRILFKLAVSDTELKHVIAEGYTIDEKYLDKIHEKGIREVRQTNGILDLKKVIEAQKGIDEWDE